MNFLLSSALLSLSCAAFLGCSGPVESDPSANGHDDSESVTSDLTGSSCHAVVATNPSAYAASARNPSRDLASVVAASDLVGNKVVIAGVVRSESSTSPYAFAATMHFGAWSKILSTGFDGHTDGSYVWIEGSGATKREGATAKALYDAMTGATETTENESVVRRSSKGGATCAFYPESKNYRCAFGPFSSIEHSTTCPKK